MLVLSRRSDEAITIPEAGVQITVLSVQGNRVRLGIDAPADIEIRRSELSAEISGSRFESDLRKPNPHPTDSTTD